MTEIKLQVGDVVELSDGDIVIVTAYNKTCHRYFANFLGFTESGESSMNPVVRVIRNALSPLNEGKYEK